jgi:hypothetical protein
MPVFILIIHARPGNDNPRFSEVAGAYVNCFIENETFDLAEQTAVKFLEDSFWIPIELEESYEVTEDNYVGDPEGLEVYKQVLIDKEIYTFHTYVSGSD